MAEHSQVLNYACDLYKVPSTHVKYQSLTTHLDYLYHKSLPVAAHTLSGP